MFVPSTVKDLQGNQNFLQKIIISYKNIIFHTKMQYLIQTGKTHYFIQKYIMYKNSHLQNTKLQNL